MLLEEKILFNEEECERIIKFTKKNQKYWNKIDRKYSSYSLDLDEENSWVFYRLRDFFENTKGEELLRLKNKIHYHEFVDGDFFSKHNDSRDNRLYSVGVLLNEDFQGGDFNLYNPNLLRIKNKRGNAYIFDVRIPHEITKVTSGKRISMIWFLEINNFKNKIGRII
jgi:hypothetical protein